MIKGVTYDLQIEATALGSAMQIVALVAHTYGAEKLKVHREGSSVILTVAADVSPADCVTITHQIEDILRDREPIQ